MGRVLESIVAAHGGVERWKRFSSISAEVALGGDGLGGAVLQPSLFCEMQTRQDRFSLASLEADDGADLLTKDRSVVDAVAQLILGRGPDPNNVRLFGSVIWRFLTTPFLYTYEGVSAEELPVCLMDGEEWQRLQIAIPRTSDSVPREEISYFGPDHLLRRTDCVSEEAELAGCMIDVSGYQDFDGILMPTMRRLFVIDQSGRRISARPDVTIKISNIEFR